MQSAIEACAALALAMPAASPDAHDDPGRTIALADIVVTARKREESLREVPISITAVAGDAMPVADQRSIADIAALVPGLNVNADQISRALVSIRGIGTAIQPGVQPGVGLFLDGIYRPYTSFANAPVLDVARIEVLRGPQGAWYGKNTLGGAINVITREPPDAFEAEVHASGSLEDAALEAGARLAGPLGRERVRGRIAVSQRDADGFYRNALIGGDVAPMHSTHVNASLSIDASDDVSVRLDGYWQDLEGGGSYSAVDDVRDYRSNVQLNVLNRTALVYQGMSARVEAGLPSLDTVMTVIAAYDSLDTEGVNDGDFLPLDVVRAATLGRDETATAELRFDTRFSERFSTLFGVFASREERDATNIQANVPSGLTVTAVTESRADTVAAFGSAIWRLQDDLELSAGLRYDAEQRDRGGFQSQSTMPGVEIPDQPRSLDASEWQPRVALTKFLREDLTIYGSVARGYRGGGFNSVAAPAEFSTYEGDSVWTVELGSKGSYDGGATWLGAAIYYNDYADFIGQNALTLGPAGGLVTIDLNLGDVESYGLELELARQVSDAWRLSGSLTRMHARIVDQGGWIAVTGAPLATERLLFQPDWNFNLDSVVTIPVGAGTLTWNLNLSGKGSRPASSFDPVEPSILESYTLLNTALAWQAGPWEISVFGNNLTNEDYWESYIDGSLLDSLVGIDQDLGVIGAPRNFGLRVQYDF